MRTLRWLIVVLCFSQFAGCMVAKHQGPWAQDMFSVFDGHPSTEAERDTATNDCLNYANRAPHYQGPVILGYQICMLSLGFRAPQGQISGIVAIPIAEGSCTQVYVRDLPVCRAEKEGWPLHPMPRWSRPGISRYKLEGDASVCSARYQGVKYAEFPAKMDQCMITMGYTVADPQSPLDIWPPESTWPDCTKPDSERNWIEKKWCPPGPSAAPRPAN